MSNCAGLKIELNTILSDINQCRLWFAVFLIYGHVSRLRIGSVLIANVSGVLFQIYPPVWPTVTIDENILQWLFLCYLLFFNRRKVCVERVLYLRNNLNQYF
jgi:hypothetical protein